MPKKRKADQLVATPAISCSSVLNILLQQKTQDGIENSLVMFKDDTSSVEEIWSSFSARGMSMDEDVLVGFRAQASAESSFTNKSLSRLHQSLLSRLDVIGSIARRPTNSFELEGRVLIVELVKDDSLVIWKR